MKKEAQIMSNTMGEVNLKTPPPIANGQPSKRQNEFPIFCLPAMGIRKESSLPSD